MWRVLPTQRLAYATNQSVLSYYIMHYYLLIGLLSVLTSLDPILLRAATLPPFGNNCTRHAVQIHPISFLLPPFSFPLRFEKNNLTLLPRMRSFLALLSRRSLFFQKFFKSRKKIIQGNINGKRRRKKLWIISSNNKYLRKPIHGYKIESPFFPFFLLCLRE